LKLRGDSRKKINMKKITLLLLIVLLSSFKPTINKHPEVKRYFYQDGVTSIERWYGNDDKIDSLKTYHRSGKINEIFYYHKGRYHGNCFQYSALGEKLTTWTFKNGKLLNRVNHKIVFNKKNELKVKKYYEALNAVNQETNYNPKRLKQIAKRADARLRLGNYTLALKDFKFLKKVTQKKAVSPKIRSSVYTSLSRIFGHFEMNKKALHYSFKAVKFSPKNVGLKYSLAYDLYRLKAYRLSQYYLKEVKKTWPEHAFSNWILGAMYSDFGEYEKAMKFINIAFKREKNILKYGIGKAERDLRTIRGLLHHKLGDSEKGIIDLNEALSNNKNNSFALRNLGVIYHDLGEFNKSCAFLTKAKELGYEKIHDRANLDFYLEQSCYRKTEIVLEKYTDKPYIYPNPVKDVINIKNLNLKKFEFEIFNFESKLIKKGILRKSTIDISTLESGLYFLKITKGKIIHSFKIIKE